MVDARNCGSAGSQHRGEVARAAAEVEDPPATRDGAQGEGPAPVAPGKLAALLFYDGQAGRAPFGHRLRRRGNLTGVRFIGRGMV